MEDKVFTSRVVERDDGGTECHCAICDITLTWFTYVNVWGSGRVVGQICHTCRNQLPLTITGIAA